MARRYLNCIKVTRNGKTMYRARLPFPFDDDLGYKPSPKDFYGKTAAEADAKRSKWKPEKPTLDKETSFARFVRDHFLPQQKELAEANRLSWGYYQNRKRRLERFFLEPEDARLGNVRLRMVKMASLMPEHMEEYFHKVAVCKINAEYHHKLKDDMRAALRMGKHKVPLKVIAEYFEDVSVPSLPKRIAKRQLFDPAQIARTILDESKPLRERALLMFAAHALRRPSEIFALKWTDIDWPKFTVMINKAVRVAEVGFEVTDGTKNKVESEIILHPYLIDLLQRMKQQPLSACETCGYTETAKHKDHQYIPKTPTDDDHIFVSSMGKMLNKDNFKRHYWPAMKKSLDLPNGPTFYSLKHLGNSFGQANGITPQAMANRMGHKSDEMARLVYREIMDTEKIQAVQVFDKFLALGATPKSSQ